MKYSIIISIYNDGALAEECTKSIMDVFSNIVDAKIDFHSQVELIFVNDGSKDRSLEHLLAVRNKHSFVKVINLSRNFGQHEAIACGFREAKGEYILRMNVDMQDHPNEIPKLITAIKGGRYDIVVGQYEKRNSPLKEKVTAYLYFELFKLLTGMPTAQNTSPLRIMNRRFIDAYNQLTEKTRFPQGLDQWLGFRHAYVTINHRKRTQGKSSYNFWSRSKLALNGILYFSDRPLTLIGMAGIGIALAGAGLGVAIIIQKLTGSTLLPGYASLASIALLGFGLQMGCMGLLGLYMGKIFREVQNRPLYIVQEIFEQQHGDTQ